ncbi:molybdopterin-dependent oxidoreductase [Bordetella genomosp. 13]|uniref:molybdopterin-dependent oxidoreductase n=1 Tax=Bordetella genomosp. 13 TaxID=463040 RepID=UPI00119D2635|nr:molybdopterin-dependent oxidoreductase [Bordetella genomosp. 13]
MTARPSHAAAVPAGTSDLAPPSGALLLHGVVLRPPRASWNGSRYTGARLHAIDRSALRGMSGLVAVVAENDYVGVVAATPELARQAGARLALDWGEGEASTTRTTAWQRRADTPAPRTGDDGGPSLQATYRWPTPNPDEAATWAIASWQDGGLTVWAADPSAALRNELARLWSLPAERIRVLPSGHRAHPCALDAAADAAMLARAVGRTVRVSASQAPRAPLATHTLRAILDASGAIAALDWQDDGSGLARPSMARLLARQDGTAPSPAAHMPPHYAFADAGVSLPAAAPLDASPTLWTATQPARVFALESFIDEAAAHARIDPVAYRLKHMDDARGAALVRRVARQAGWPGSDGGTAASSALAHRPARTGRGFAYACTLDDSTEPARRVWSAWVAEVAVDAGSGDVALSRVVVGHDADDAHAAPDAHAAALTAERLREAAQRLLPGQAAFDDWSSRAARDEAAPPLAIDLLAPTGALAPAGDALAPSAAPWSDAATLPAAAAVANAIYDATGVRLRAPPFDSAATRQALAITGPARRGRRPAYAWLGGIAAAAAGLIVSALPWRSAIAPVAAPDLSLYSPQAIERGRLVAAAGDCVVCHTAPGGTPNAGGLALDTPFGTIYTTNITPDADTGIGNWSYAAFDRAMRQGVHRDGRQLYPAFPYTSFAKLTEADMQALYAYMMSQPAVRSAPPETRLAFPYNVRPLMAGWNLLFHDNQVYQPDPAQSLAWNRGAYLVQGAGHCGACHTPRNALGAERRGLAALLAGGEAEGWEAPALNGLSRAPVPWTEDDLYAYLRTGFSERHGVAAGPMAPVIHGLAELPDQDVRAMAVYLASLNPAVARQAGPDQTAPGLAGPSPAAQAAAVNALEAASAPDARLFPAGGERLFQGACAACHETRDAAPLFGARPSLALNTNLHSDRPDNLIQVILHGIADPAGDGLGYMPAFGGSLDDAQVTQLVEYMRVRFAPQRPAWTDVSRRVGELRATAQGGHAASAGATQEPAAAH